MTDIIIGNFQYCYNNIPVIRGYCSSKLLIKYSHSHPAYQRIAETGHVEEIKEFLDGTSIKFMPEIVLSYDYSGMLAIPQEWNQRGYMSPFQFLCDSSIPGIVKIWDYHAGVEFRRLKKDEVNTTIQLSIPYGNPIFDTHQVFNRIDGNHRLEALEQVKEDYLVPFCIVLLASSGNPLLRDREKMEMEIFHNINSKVKPLSPLEQYRGLFRLFSVDELLPFGKEFSLTRAYLEKHNLHPYSHITVFLREPEDIVLYCIRFLLDRKIAVTEDDIAEVLAALDHTYFCENEIIRSCKSRLAIVPYVYYCFVGGKQKNAKLSAYNTWFIKNRLYNVNEFDPASMIETFDSIYEIRKKQIFVAMPFKDELMFVYEAICEVVEKINRDNGIDLLPPIRIDKQIVGFSYDIVNELLDQIQNAGLLIADLTGQNANVYYEAGFAQGLLRAKLGNTAEILYLISNPEKPDEPFAQAKFDVNHYKMIPYKNDGNGVRSLKEDLEKELKAFYNI